MLLCHHKKKMSHCATCKLWPLYLWASFNLRVGEKKVQYANRLGKGSLLLVSQTQGHKVFKTWEKSYHATLFDRYL